RRRRRATVGSKHGPVEAWPKESAWLRLEPPAALVGAPHGPAPLGLVGWTGVPARLRVGIRARPFAAAWSRRGPLPGPPSVAHWLLGSRQRDGAGRRSPCASAASPWGLPDPLRLLGTL